MNLIHQHEHNVYSELSVEELKELIKEKKQKLFRREDQVSPILSKYQNYLHISYDLFKIAEGNSETSC